MRRRSYYSPPVIETTHRGNGDIIEVMASKFWGIGTIIFSETTKAIKEWDNTMARKTYRIELKIDFNDDTRHEHLVAVCKQYARDLLASAMLLQDGRPPAVALITDDTFAGNEVISVMEESENVHRPDPS